MEEGSVLLVRLVQRSVLVVVAVMAPLALLRPREGWELQVDVRRGEFDLLSDNAKVSIGEEP